MKEPTRSAKKKRATRALVRVGSRTTRAPRVAQKGLSFSDPTLCAGCGALYSRRTWRVRPRLSAVLMAEVTWDTCPACRQVARGIAHGCVIVRGVAGKVIENAIRQRIENVARRARVTQPERRVVDVSRRGVDLEIRTTSQKLAHRFARELEKAFGGAAVYRWSADDGSLRATWKPGDLAD